MEQILHIFGAIILQIVLFVAYCILSLRSMNKYQDYYSMELSMQLGVPIDEIENKENESALKKYLAEKYSDDLWSNRFANLFGYLHYAIRAIGLIAILAYNVMAIYFVVTGLENAHRLLWFGSALMVFYYVIELLLWKSCRFLTGRIPGQPKESLKHLMKLYYLNKN